MKQIKDKYIFLNYLALEKVGHVEKKIYRLVEESTYIKKITHDKTYQLH